MNFDELWEHQQGAIFLKKDHIYDCRKDLAEFFFRYGKEKSNIDDVEFQTWICPKCCDDHFQDADCTQFELFEFLPSESDKSFIAEKYREQNKKIKDLEARQERILEYCQNNTHLMWAAQIVSIVFDCDFRDAEHMMMKRGAK